MNPSALRNPPPASSDTVRRVMQGNRKRDTKPELALRRALHERGLRYRIDMKIGQGRSAPRPDIVFQRARVAVFVQGCYWHGCHEHGVLPKKNSEYWQAKIRRNQERDAANARALQEQSWLVLQVWEHEDPLAAARMVEAAVRGRGLGA